MTRELLLRLLSILLLVPSGDVKIRDRLIVLYGKCPFSSPFSRKLPRRRLGAGMVLTAVNARPGTSALK